MSLLSLLNAVFHDMKIEVDSFKARFNTSGSLSGVARYVMEYVTYIEG